jgi:Skp family chaperone for outer membrane proteins
MKKIIIAIAVAASLLVTSTFAGPQDGILDMQKVFAKSTTLKSAAQAMKKKYGAQQASIKKQTAVLKHNVQFLQKNGATMSKASLAKLQTKVQGEQQTLQKAQMTLQQQVMATQHATMNAFMGSLKAATQKVAKKKGIVIVFPNNAVVYSAPSMDITDAVIAKLND